MKVRSAGFNSRVGQVSFPEEDSRNGQGRRPFSNSLTTIIDEEVNKLIFAAYKKTEQIISENSHKLELVKIISYRYFFHCSYQF